MSCRQSDSWTPERTERFVVMWNDGRLSASEIAAVFARQECRSVSRNAILGKAHRMKLPPRLAKVGVVPSLPKRKRVAKKPKAKMPAAVVAAPVLEAPFIEIARIPLTELTDATCKWPIGDPKASNFGFCGLPAAEGHVYCSAHHRRSIQPPRPVSMKEHVHAVA